MRAFRARHRVSKQDLKEDRFQTFVEKTAEAYYRDRQRFWVIGGIVLAVVIGAILFIQSRGRGGPNSEAQLRFTEALGIYTSGQPEQAEQAFKDVAGRFRSDPVGITAHYYLGQLYYSSGRFAEAKQEFARFLSRAKGDPILGPGAQLGIANCDEELGDYLAAGREYEKVLRSYPKSPIAFDAAMSAGRAYIAAGAHDQAERVYTALKEQEPSGDKALQLARQLSYLEALKGKF